MRYHAVRNAALAFAHKSQPVTPILNATRIYVDADACPVKDEIYRIAARHALPVSVVASGFIRVPQEPMIERVAAGSGIDAADDWIAERAGPFSIVVTSDIPLADRCVRAGSSVIAPNSGSLPSSPKTQIVMMLRDPSTDIVAWAQSRSISAPLAKRNRRRKLGAIPRFSRTDCGIHVYAAPVSTQALSFRERNPSMVLTSISF